MPQRSDLVFTVDLCPRCGQQHDDIQFERMRSPIAGTISSDEFDLFATCPMYAEPILARIVGEGEVEVR